MNKKSTLILSVAILGLLSAGAMWFMTGAGGFPLRGGVMMDESVIGLSRPTSNGVMMEDSSGMQGGSMGAGIMAGEIVGRDMVTSIAPYPYYPPSYGDDALNVSDRTVEKYSSHTFVVTNVSQYIQKTKDYVTSIGGVVLSYNQGSSDRFSYGYLSFKVPTDKFDEAVSEVSKDVKKVVDESVNVQDVTGQTVSVEERLQQLRDDLALQEAALEDATTAAERQKIQNLIDNLERQITQVEQNQEAMTERVEYSTINISVADKESYFNYGGPRPLWDVVQEAWWSLKDTAQSIIAFLIWVVVYAIIWVPVLLLARWIWGKVRPAANNTTSKK